MSVHTNINRCVGGYSVGATPGPIPNPEAKPDSADGTALGRVWESKSPPTKNLTPKNPVDHHDQRGSSHTNPNVPSKLGIILFRPARFQSVLSAVVAVWMLGISPLDLLSHCEAFKITYQWRSAEVGCVNALLANRLDTVHSQSPFTFIWL